MFRLQIGKFIFNLANYHEHLQVLNFNNRVDVSFRECRPTLITANSFGMMFVMLVTYDFGHTMIRVLSEANVEIKVEETFDDGDGAIKFLLPITHAEFKKLNNFNSSMNDLIWVEESKVGVNNEVQPDGTQVPAGAQRIYSTGGYSVYSYPKGLFDKGFVKQQLMTLPEYYRMLAIWPDYVESIQVDNGTSSASTGNFVDRISFWDKKLFRMISIDWEMPGADEKFEKLPKEAIQLDHDKKQNVTYFLIPKKEK